MNELDTKAAAFAEFVAWYRGAYPFWGVCSLGCAETLRDGGMNGYGVLRGPERQAFCVHRSIGNGKPALSISENLEMLLLSLSYEGFNAGVTLDQVLG
jgi:hypothetical protein